MKNFFYFRYVLLGIGCFSFFNSVSYRHRDSELKGFFESCISLPENKQLYNRGPLLLTESSFPEEAPSLIEVLIFYKPSVRPDMNRNGYSLMLKGSQDKVFIAPGERVYLNFNITNFQEEDYAYTFSKDNKPSDLWLEIESISLDQLQLSVAIKSHKNENNILKQKIILSSQEKSLNKEEKWVLDDYKVDSSLLTKQKTIWVGKDLFFETYEGSEGNYKNKERLDFINKKNGETYTRFLSLGEFLVWKDQIWVYSKEVPESENFPILFLKKVEEKIISFELWEALGACKQNLSLLKMPLLEECEILNRELDYVGLKTWSQPIISTKSGKRIFLKKNDWLIRTEKDWEKITSVEVLDDYLEGKTRAPLFIFEKLDKVNGDYVLLGQMFSTLRNEKKEIKLFLQQFPPKEPSQKPSSGEDHSD